MSQETRRAAFNKARAKAADIGLKFEDDPGFIEAVERWIAEEIDNKALRAAYLGILYARENTKALERGVMKPAND